MHINKLNKLSKFLFNILIVLLCITNKNILAEEISNNQLLKVNQDNFAASIEIDPLQVSTSSNNIKVLELTQPNRVAIDIYNLKDKKNLLTYLDTLKKSLKENGYIKSIRIGDYNEKIRIVFDLSLETKYSTNIIKEANSIKIILNNFVISSTSTESESKQLNSQDTQIATISPTIQISPTHTPTIPQTPTIQPPFKNKESPTPTILNTFSSTITPTATLEPTVTETIIPTAPPFHDITSNSAEVKKLTSEILGVYFTTEPKNQLIFKLDHKRAFTFNPLNDNLYILKIDGIKDVKDSFLLPFYAPKNFPNIESLIIDKNSFDILITVDEPKVGSSDKVKNLRAFSKGDEIIVE